MFPAPIMQQRSPAARDVRVTQPGADSTPQLTAAIARRAHHAQTEALRAPAPGVCAGDTNLTKDAQLHPETQPETPTLSAADQLREDWQGLTPEERLAGFIALPRADADDFFLEL